MKIDKIKKSGTKYKIILDNNDVINTYDNVILDNNLLFNKEINSDDLNKINEDTDYYRIYNKMVKKIAQRLRSEYEINNYLNNEDIKETDKNKIITELKKINLINDYNFAKAYTNDKINLSLDGPNKIRKELEKHNISNDIIDEVIDLYKEEVIDNHIEKIILKKLKANKKYSGYILKQKIINYLLEQGYLMEDINKHIYLIKNNNGFNEMEKIYKKCLLKYTDDNLYYQFTNKMLAKGFTKEEINNFMQEKNS